MLKLAKLFNNNVVLVQDESGYEYIVVGKGIGFAKKVGEEIAENLVERKFRLVEDEFTDRLIKLIGSVSEQSFYFTEQIISFANKRLEKPLSNTIYLSLTDHLYHAIKRAERGQILQNELLFEIKRLYSKEFSIGCYAVELVLDSLGIDLTDNEAGFIALHIFNARNDSENMQETIRTMHIVCEILRIVSQHFQLTLDESRREYSRFVLHLQYFALRLFRENADPIQNNALYQQAKSIYPQAYQCVEKINYYLLQQFRQSLSQDEALYLIIHIERVIH
ncbi:BglG family transcription antiterminator LicT [Rodentibacter caecimuris]|uniref:PRD domain-containing protein n=1 Tax=Rodentibacter caecimuris TaxID=1796644 RepID=A0ABX3L135_9PAST|nr:hypothetical protein BKG89_00565 [Rodentibacter heylii]